MSWICCRIESKNENPLVRRELKKGCYYRKGETRILNSHVSIPNRIPIIHRKHFLDKLLMFCERENSDLEAAKR
jgi:hypothetical protein